MKEKLATAMIAIGIVIMCIGLSGCLGGGGDDPAPSPGSPDTTQPTTTPVEGPEQTTSPGPGHVQYPNEEGTLPDTGGVRLAT